MSFTRRQVVFAAAGGLSLVLAGATWRVMRSPDAARAPWRMAEALKDDVRLGVFSQAILAPNPHNRQPWLITLVGRDEAIIRCDLDRRLPETDPFDRQITIGFGAFLGLARIAAASSAIRLEITQFPDGLPGPRLDTRPVAQVRFVRDAAVRPDPLHAHMLTRRSVKRPFDMARPPGDTAITAITAAANGTGVTMGHAIAAERVAAIRAIAWDAWMVEALTPATHMESVNLIRIGASEVNANPDGISLTGPFIEALALAGQLSRPQLGDPRSSAFATGRERYREMIAATPAFLWWSSAGNTRQDQLATGEAYLRANLAATAQGLGLHPLSQALQEFPQMAEIREKMLAALGGGQVQMLARIGHGAQVEPSPRWPLATKLTS